MIYNQLEFKPKENERYYFINFNNMEVVSILYRETIPEYYSADDVINGINYATNNCFKTRKLAEEYLKMHNEIERLKREYPVEWENCSPKYYLGCGIDEIYTMDAYSVAIQGSFYISNEEVLQQFIKEYKSSIKKFIFGIEEEELYYIRFPFFYEDDNYLRFSDGVWWLSDADYDEYDQLMWTKEECNKIITNNKLQNFVELEKVEK